MNTIQNEAEGDIGIIKSATHESGNPRLRDIVQKES